MPLDETIVAAVGNANFKSMAEMGVQNALLSQQRLQIMGETALGKVLDDMRTTSVPEGLGLSAAQRGDLSKTITELAGAVASIQNMLQAPRTPSTG